MFTAEGAAVERVRESSEKFHKSDLSEVRKASTRKDKMDCQVMSPVKIHRKRRLSDRANCVMYLLFSFHMLAKIKKIT